jgi:hypothetical protein
VEDTADGGTLLFLENLQAARQGAAAMEKERQPGGDGDAQLRAEDDLLLRPGHGDLVVKADFADGDDRRVGEELRQAFRHGW